jgi:hypothetical protein
MIHHVDASYGSYFLHGISSNEAKPLTEHVPKQRLFNSLKIGLRKFEMYCERLCSRLEAAKTNTLKTT